MNSAKLSEDDFIKQLFVASTHDYIMYITSKGKAYWMKVHEIPEGSRTSRGAHIKSLLAVSPNEDITTVVAFKDFRDEEFFEPKEILEKAGFQIDVASTEKGTAVGVNGGEAEVNFAVEEVNVDDYQAIVFVGGPGASRNIENQRFHHLAQRGNGKK